MRGFPALLRALASRPGRHAQSKSRPSEAFRVKPHDFGFDPKLDLDKMNRLVDDLEAVESVQKLGK